MQRVELQRWPMLFASDTAGRLLHGYKHGPLNAASKFFFKQRLIYGLFIQIYLSIKQINNFEPE